MCSLYYPLLRVYLGGYAINGSMFGSGDIPMVIQNINCKGTEKFLTDCSTASSSTSSTTSLCNNSTVAGIACYGKFYFYPVHACTNKVCVFFLPVCQSVANIYITISVTDRVNLALRLQLYGRRHTECTGLSYTFS